MTKAENPLLQTTSTYMKVVGNKPFTLTTGAQGAVTFKSSNKKVATVGTTTGKVKIKGAGKSVITVTAAGNDTYNSAVVDITIIVKPKKSTVSSAKSIS